MVTQVTLANENRIPSLDRWPFLRLRDDAFEGRFKEALDLHISCKEKPVHLRGSSSDGILMRQELFHTTFFELCDYNQKQENGWDSRHLYSFYGTTGPSFRKACLTVSNIIL